MLCEKEKPVRVLLEKYTGVLPDRFWTGIHILRTNHITAMQKRLQKLRNTFATQKEEHPHNRLHITLAFPAKVDMLHKTKSPIDFLIFDRITIVRKEKNGEAYKIMKHIPFG